MSIRIDKEKCIACGRCEKICPGNLIVLERGFAKIKYPKDCWGCVSCVKECAIGAISFFLGADIGGDGSTMQVISKGDILYWNIVKEDKLIMKFTIDKKVSNQY